MCIRDRTITLEVDGGFVSKEYAAIAKDAAEKAQQALEAIPQVDDAGNMTLAGGLTAAGAVNANGGINIPLAVGAATDTSAVNRLYAAGSVSYTHLDVYKRQPAGLPHEKN